MNFRLSQKIVEQIDNEFRSIALLAMPGMGLTSLITSITNLDPMRYVEVKPELLIQLWNEEYGKRDRNKRYVVHAAAIIAMMEKYSISNLTKAEIFLLNLPKFSNTNEYGFSGEKLYIVIDGFEKLPDELAVIILDETKYLDDHRDDETLRNLRGLRFLIGGAINFNMLYQQKSKKSVSPATNFSKHRPYEFLLTEDETQSFLAQNFNKLSQDDISFIIEFTRGYIHYSYELGNWIENQKKERPRITLPALTWDLKECIKDSEPKRLLKYCAQAWKKYQKDSEAISFLSKVASCGIASSESALAVEMHLSGLLIPTTANVGVYQFSNRIVELYIRQKLFDIDKGLSIDESPSWVVSGFNINAYARLLEIENRMRTYIADTLVVAMKCSSVNDLGTTIAQRFTVNGIDGKGWWDGINSRENGEKKSMHYSSDSFDSIISYLDFSDLGIIVENFRDVFSKELTETIPVFMSELNFIRRRIAHNRPISNLQLTDLTSRWDKIQRLLQK